MRPSAMRDRPTAFPSTTYCWMAQRCAEWRRWRTGAGHRAGDRHGAGPESSSRLHRKPGVRYDANILNSMATENIAKQMSCSWGWDPDDSTTDDVFFQEFAAQGQSFFHRVRGRWRLRCGDQSILLSRGGCLRNGCRRDPPDHEWRWWALGLRRQRGIQRRWQRGRHQS